MFAGFYLSFCVSTRNGFEHAFCIYSITISNIVVNALRGASTIIWDSFWPKKYGSITHILDPLSLVQVHMLSQGCLEESRRVNDALERKEIVGKIAAGEKAKHLQALKEVEDARKLLVKEAYARKIAEVNALRESLEKQKVVDSLLLNDRRYRTYTRDEIEVATNFFSESNVIGEGAYGKVYRCNLDHTPVAVKVLSPDTVDKKKDEFLKEVSFSS